MTIFLVNIKKVQFNSIENNTNYNAKTLPCMELRLYLTLYYKVQSIFKIKA